MKVVWSKDAKSALGETTDYLQAEFGHYTRRHFLQEVYKVAKLLENKPFIGKVEPLLVAASDEYRSLVVARLNKLIYYVDSAHETVEIVDLWDTRREPISQANHLFT